MPVYMKDQVLYTVEELADILSLSRETIRKHLREKKLVGRKMSRVWYVTSEDLQAYFGDMFGGTLTLPPLPPRPPIKEAQPDRPAPRPAPKVWREPPPPVELPPIPEVSGDEWREEIERLKAQLEVLKREADQIINSTNRGK